MTINVNNQQVEAYDLLLQKKYALDIIQGKKKIEVRSFSDHYISRFLDKEVMKRNDANNRKPFDDDYLSQISAFAYDTPQIATFTVDDFLPPAKAPVIVPDEEKKAAVKASKQAIKEQCEERARNESAYITLSFTSHIEKSEFCAMLGIDTDAHFAKGEDVLRLFE